MKVFSLLVFFMTCCSIVQSNVGMTSVSIHSVSSFPSGETGYSLGVSACYAGAIGDWLIMAGGCNFPEPGHKKYYSGIYAAKATGDSLQWKFVGNLPEPAAYGATVVQGDSLVLLGGCNNDHSLRTVLSIHLREKENGSVSAEIKILPLLPIAMDNMAAASLDDTIYIIGGNQDGKPSTHLWALDTKYLSARWQALPDIPNHPRVQPVCAAWDGKVYVWGGFDAAERLSQVAADGYVYDTHTLRWQHLEAPKDSMARDVTLSGGAATIIMAEEGHPTIVATGGVNKDIFLDAISGRYERVKREDYMHQPIAWYQFNAHLFCYDLLQGRWLCQTWYDARLARAGAQLVPCNESLYYIGGELKPGVRTPLILKIK